MVRRCVPAPLLLILGLVFPAALGAATFEVTNSAGLTSALADAQNGDRVHVNAPGPYRAPSQGWHITRSIELFGDGSGHDWTNDATTLWAASPSDPVLVLDVSQTPDKGALQNVHIHDLQIRGLANPPCAPAPNSNGIVFDNAAFPRRLLSNLRLERLSINDMGNDGIHLTAANLGAGAIVGLTMIDCMSAHNCANGLTLRYATVPYILRGYFQLNRQMGARITGCDEPQIVGCVFEDNEDDGAHAAFSPQLFMETVHAFLVQGCHFESFNKPVSKTALTVVGGHGGYIGSNTFGNADGAGTRGIYIYAGSPPSPSSSVVLGPNAWGNVDVLIELHDHPLVTSCVVLPQAVTNADAGIASRIIIPESADRGHVVMPATGIGPAGGAAFNLTAGVEFPRLSAARRDSMTAASSGGTRREGLVIYNVTTHELNYWNGSAWRAVTSKDP